MLPRLAPPSKSTAPSDPQLQKQELSGSLSRLPMPRQQQNPQAPSSSMLRFPSLIKPQHRIPPLPEPSKCNQEDEEQKEHPNGDLSARKALKGGGGNNGDEEDEDAIRTSNSRSTSGPAPGGLTATRPIGDKNRDFIRELEEKKRKQKEDQARQERRKQKLQEKLSRRILEEAAQARQKQQPELSEPEENGQGEQTGDDQPHEDQSDLRKGQSDESATRPESKELRERKEKIKRQKRLLKKQQTLLEQIQTKKKEKQEGLELEKEKERRKQEKVKKAILDAIYDANSRMQEEEEEEAQQSSEDDEETTQQGLKTEVGGHRSSAGATLAATAAGSVMALLRDRKEALAAVATTPAVPQEEVNEEQKQRVKEQRDAINRKQQEYLQKLADQRRQKQKEEEEARLLQEKRKKKIQQEALLRHQEVSKQQQEVAAAAQKEKDESAEKMATAAPPVDVEAMVARLSRLKERDAQVIPEARDYASWKKRHGVRPDQNVFCMTGAYPVIREELEKRGWYYNHEKVSPFFDLKWSLKSDDLKAFKLEKHQYVNHFFQNTAITTKVGLLHNLRNMVWHQSVDIDTIFPRAYDLNEPRDMETFIQDFRYGFAEGLLKELARIYVQRKKKKTISIKANIGVLDVLLSVARKKLKSKRSDVQDFPAPEDNDPLEESIDSQFSTSSEELVTNMQWEALTKCQVDKPGSLRASLMYKKKIFVEDRADASFGIEANGSSGASQVNGSSVDTVLSALEKKQQRQIEKQRVEAFNREKARLNQLLAQVSSIDETTMNDVVGLVKALERLCPQFRINGGCDFLLSGDQQANGAEAESMSSKSRNIWIVKPAGMSRGRGIRVFNNLDLLLEYADVENHKECQWVAQKYIENPLLMCKRKFDIRQWVLVTGWDPLTVWFYQDCYLRFSSEEYSIDDLSDQYVHLTNNSIQKYSDKFNDAYATDDGDIRVVGNMLHSDDFKQYIRTKLHKEDIWDTSIQPRMKDIVIASLQCVQDMVQHRTNCCELFGYDFMIDTDLKPWLIEVNSSPACDYSTPTAERYVKTGLADIIKVIVDHREFEQKKKSGGGAALAEPDTGCWQRIHKAEYIGKPVSSFGADFFVKGAKVQKAKRNRNSSSTGSGAKANNYNSATSGPSASSVSVTHDVVESGGAGGFMVVEEEDEEAVGHQGDDSRAIDQEPSSLAAAEEEESDASEDGENEEETGPPHAAHDEQRPWDPDESCRADEGDDCEDDGAASDLGGDLDVDPLL
uniref:ATP-grasp domain-containing protein n=1 Tax=Globisporangium ultimum (strain ATCC 200006 / CBS 805.95 / DAOM BR144) TaxID=431595 RepID=K3XBP5_GLOUD